MCLVEHVFECIVIVVGVRRRVQELHVGLDCRRSRGPWAHNLWSGRTRRWSPYSRFAACAHELQELEEEDKGREEVQETERESQVEERRSDDHEHGDGAKDSNT